ncbi:MAG: hypothetical protein ACRDL2_14090 [Gaiellaceae bacterium]
MLLILVGVPVPGERRVLVAAEELEDAALLVFRLLFLEALVEPFFGMLPAPSDHEDRVPETAVRRPNR